MHMRVALLAVVVLLVGIVTRAFAQTVPNDGPLTRGGAIALMVEANPGLQRRLEYFVAHRPPMPLFADVDYNEWYAPYVETAFEAGIVTGNPNGLFSPGRYLTEDEAIILVARYRAIDRADIAPQLSSGGDALQGAYTALQQTGITMPTPLRLGQPIARSVFLNMLAGAGVSNPQAITLSHTRTAAIAQTFKPSEQAPAGQVYRPQIVASTLPTPSFTPTTTITQQTASSTIYTQAQYNALNGTTTSYVPPVGSNTQTVTTAAATSYASSKSFAITMPSLGIKDLSITHPANAFTKDGLLAPLKYGVGHLFGYPGAGSKILVYGHSSSYAWDVSSYTKIFRQINKLNVGDKIYVTYNGTLYTYEVNRKQTIPAGSTAGLSGPGEELVLYTCWPPDSIKERYLVFATPVSTVAVK